MYYTLLFINYYLIKKKKIKFYLYKNKKIYPLITNKKFFKKIKNKTNNNKQL